jgi:hypothetical protein
MTLSQLYSPFLHPGRPQEGPAFPNIYTCRFLCIRLACCFFCERRLHCVDALIVGAMNTCNDTRPRISVCKFYNTAKIPSKDKVQETLPRDGILLSFGLCVVASMVAAVCTAELEYCENPQQRQSTRDTTKGWHLVVLWPLRGGKHGGSECKAEPVQENTTKGWHLGT